MTTTPIGLGNHERLIRALSPARRLRHVLSERGTGVRSRYGIPLSRQAVQILYHHWRFGMGRAEYYMFEMYRQDLARSERAAYLSQSAWAALSRVINHPDRAADDSKLVLARRLEAAGVPVPRTLACTAVEPSPDVAQAPEFVPFERISDLVPPEGCVVKRDYSTWGLAVFVFTAFEDGAFTHVDGRRVQMADLGTAMKERGGAFLIQERLRNHPRLASLGLPSLATVRLLTYGAPGDVRVARASLKLPVGDSGIDNYHAGGIAAPIDLRSGEVGEGADARQLDRITAHPASGRTFASLVLPFWDEVVSTTRRAAAALPEFACVGWDVAITPAGPVVIEANSVWGTGIVQRPHRRGLWQGEFRDWCLQRVHPGQLERPVRRWLGL